MLDRLRQFSSALGSVPSLVYAMIYVALIPSFAAFYYFVLPSDFYHSTAQFEYGPMNRAAERILQGLQGSIMEHFKEARGNSACGTWDLDLDTLKTSRLGVEDGNVAFSIYAHLRQRQGKFTGAEEYTPLQLFFSLNSRIRTWEGKGLAPVDHFEIVTKEGYQPAFEGSLGSKDLIKCVFPASSEVPMAGVIYIPGTLTADIVRFSEAKRGFPAQMSGQFVRMLYLSASTITTLGFGDIVPLTTSARLAVSVEAVLGIVMMGLFLNAIAKER